MSLSHGWRSTYLLKVEPNFSQVDLEHTRTLQATRHSSALGVSGVLVSVSLLGLSSEHFCSVINPGFDLFEIRWITVAQHAFAVSGGRKLENGTCK